MNELTAKQLATLRKLLNERAAAIAQTMQDQVDRLRAITDPELTSAVGDMADQAEIARSREDEHAAVDRETAELRDIEAARQRIDDGDAGICIDCDEAIAFKRLLARPTATRCINCQSVAEHPSRLALGKPWAAGAVGNDTPETNRRTS